VTSWGTGTADRKFHDPGAGIKGFILPPGATAETRRLYAEKIVVIPYSKDWRKDQVSEQEGEMQAKEEQSMVHCLFDGDASAPAPQWMAWEPTSICHHPSRTKRSAYTG
jgi:hypothetical protein